MWTANAAAMPAEPTGFDSDKADHSNVKAPTPVATIRSARSGSSPSRRIRIAVSIRLGTTVTRSFQLVAFTIPRTAVTPTESSTDLARRVRTISWMPGGCRSG